MLKIQLFLNVCLFYLFLLISLVYIFQLFLNFNFYHFFVWIYDRLLIVNYVNLLWITYHELSKLSLSHFIASYHDIRWTIFRLYICYHHLNFFQNMSFVKLFFTIFENKIFSFCEISPPVQIILACFCFSNVLPWFFTWFILSDLFSFSFSCSFCEVTCQKLC